MDCGCCLIGFVYAEKLENDVGAVSVRYVLLFRDRIVAQLNDRLV